MLHSVTEEGNFYVTTYIYMQVDIIYQIHTDVYL